MLLIDDILLSPYKGLLWVFEEIHNTAVDELEGEAERIRTALDAVLAKEAEMERAVAAGTAWFAWLEGVLRGEGVVYVD